jgi:hypothetical protein
VWRQERLRALKGGYHGHWNLRGENPTTAGPSRAVWTHANGERLGDEKPAPISIGLQDRARFHHGHTHEMYNEAPPNDDTGRITQLPGIPMWSGFLPGGGDFRYYELYPTRYLEFDAPAQEMRRAGRLRCREVIKPGYGVFFASSTMTLPPRP